MLLRVSGSVIVDFAIRVFVRASAGSLLSRVALVRGLHRAVQHVLADRGQLRGLLLFLFPAFLGLSCAIVGAQALVIVLILIRAAVAWLEEVILGRLADERAGTAPTFTA